MKRGTAGLVALLLMASLGCGGNSDEGSFRRASQGGDAEPRDPWPGSSQTSAGTAADEFGGPRGAMEVRPAPMVRGADTPPWPEPPQASRRDVAPGSPGAPTTHLKVDLTTPPMAMESVDLSHNDTAANPATGSDPHPTMFRKERSRPKHFAAAPSRLRDDGDDRRGAVPGSMLTNSAVSSVDARGFARVKVFYATNRSPEVAANILARFFWPAVLSAVTGLLLVLRRFGYRATALRNATIVSIAVTFFMLLVTGYRTMGVLDRFAKPGRHYGHDRGRLELGTCEVSIPERHEVGAMEAPSVFRFEIVQDPTKHVTLLEAAPVEADGFFQQVRSRVAGSPRRDAVVFIHGFNVSFEKAARRTAQMAYDLNFEGAPIFFSWPSQAGTFGTFQYAADRESADWATPDLTDFLRDIAQKSGAKSVHLIAHSMGNRLLTAALKSLAPEVRGRDRFHEIILAAPDIDADIFRRDIAPAIVGTGKRITLYASSRDKALQLSREINGGQPRAGDSGEDLVIVRGIDTIDASAVDESVLGHSYYASSEIVLSDLFSLIKRDRNPGDTGWLQPRDVQDGLRYWVFEPAGRAIAAGTRALKR